MIDEVDVKSDIASAMGARIRITGPVCGMYLIIGHSTLPEALVKAAGGEIVLRLSGNRILVILPFKGYLSLQGDCRVRHIGPVSVDVKRLTRVAEMLAKTTGPKSKVIP